MPVGTVRTVASVLSAKEFRHTRPCNVSNRVFVALPNRKCYEMRFWNGRYTEVGLYSDGHELVHWWTNHGWRGERDDWRLRHPREAGRIRHDRAQSFRQAEE